MDLKKARTELLEYRKKDITRSIDMLWNSQSASDFWIVNSLKRELESINEELLRRKEENTNV
jgi:hypothetical protein